MNETCKSEIFISYRRDGGVDYARMIYLELNQVSTIGARDLVINGSAEPRAGGIRRRSRKWSDTKSR